jgi:decaprenyl-phosphate phosphoribosyltransferase
VTKYLQLLRVSHWFKNSFILLGVLVSYTFEGSQFEPSHITQVIVAFLLASLISSVNYIINQIADVEFDARHPDKKSRPLPSKRISIKSAILLGSIILFLSLSSAYIFFNPQFYITLTILFIAGIAYNINPIRLKDRPYIDVISESFNNPVRFLLGWFVLNQTIPPLSFLFWTWFLGAFLMTAKRYDELLYWGKNLIPYRKTFNTYSLYKLKVMMIFYCTLSLLILVYIGITQWFSLLYIVPILVLFFAWIIKEVLSGKAEARTIESFMISRSFVIWFLCSILLVCLILWLLM